MNPVRPVLRRRYGHAVSSKAKLEKELERLRKRKHAVNLQLIADGRGREMPSETALKTDALSVEATVLNARIKAIETELELRNNRAYWRANPIQSAVPRQR